MCHGEEADSITAGKMPGPLGHQAAEQQVTRQGSLRGLEVRVRAESGLAVPDGYGEVPRGALAGPDDEETNLLGHE